MDLMGFGFDGIELDKIGLNGVLLAKLMQIA